jgi:DNA-binding response OmpR family regulator
VIDIFENENFDIVFLDENMPGMSGLETLSEMKEKKILRSDDYDHQK